jgi:hypothetical protein
MWLALARRSGRAEDLERTLRRLGAVLQVSEELERRLAATGVGGLAGVLDVQHRMKSVLDAVPLDEIERALAAARVLAATLGTIARRVDELRRLKGSVGV